MVLAPWQFIQSDDIQKPKWTWRRIGPDELPAFSGGPFFNYDAAVVHCMRAGFRPNIDHYVVITGSGLRHINQPVPVTLAPVTLAPVTPTPETLQIASVPAPENPHRPKAGKPRITRGRRNKTSGARKDKPPAANSSA